MVAGIVLSAFALREAVAQIGHDLASVPALALCGGSALYIASYVAIRWRVTRNVRSGRLIASIVFMTLFPIALVTPAIAALAAVAATWIGLHAYELIWWRQARTQTRALRTTAL